MARSTYRTCSCGAALHQHAGEDGGVWYTFRRGLSRTPCIPHEHDKEEATQ